MGGKAHLYGRAALAILPIHLICEENEGCFAARIFKKTY